MENDLVLRSAEYTTAYKEMLDIILRGAAQQVAATSVPALNIHAGVPDASWNQGKEIGGTTILFADNHAKYIKFNNAAWSRLYDTPLSGS